MNLHNTHINHHSSPQTHLKHMTQRITHHTIDQNKKKSSINTRENIKLSEKMIQIDDYVNLVTSLYSQNTRENNTNHSTYGANLEKEDRQSKKDLEKSR